MVCPHSCCVQYAGQQVSPHSLFSSHQRCTSTLGGFHACHAATLPCRGLTGVRREALLLHAHLPPQSRPDCFSLRVMSRSPSPPAEPRASTGKQKRSEQGWTRCKARDAHCSEEQYEARDASPSPSPFGASDAGKVRRSLLRTLLRMARSQPPNQIFAVAMVRMDTNKPQGGHWPSALWRAQLGDTRSPEPFLSVTTSNYATTQHCFILRGKMHLIYNVRDLRFPAPSAAASPATSSNTPHSAR